MALTTAAMADHPTERLRIALRLVWALDLGCWAAVTAGGFVVLLTRPVTVELVLAPIPPLVWAFAALWIGGGVAGLVTRGLQLGIAERPAITAAMTAIATYVLVVLCAELGHGYTNGGMALVLCTVALCLLARRLVGLYLQGSEGDDARRAYRLLGWAWRALRS